MKKQFRIDNSNTFLVSKNNDQSKLTFAIEEIDEILDKRKIKICNHYHDKISILNHLIHNSNNTKTLCPNCKNNNNNNISSAVFIDTKVNEKDLEIIYVYRKDSNSISDREEFDKTYKKMYDLFHKAILKNEDKDDDYIDVTNKIFKNDKPIDRIYKQFILILTEKGTFRGCYYCDITTTDELTTDEGYFYIPNSYRGGGYCKILSKNVFGIQKNEIRVKKYIFTVLLNGQVFFVIFLELWRMN